MSAEQDPELGITDHDRQQMAEWAENGVPHEVGGGDGPVNGSPDLTHPTVKAVRVEVAMRHAGGTEFLKAKHIAEDVEYTPHQVGQALRTLADHGMVEKHSYTGSSTTWKITL